ncbi:glycosyltransferase [Marmoricola sp. RAF53]|uniref:glycosyltransferase n=1 Tax=Marmoricola sp. RAF53 TaxID=3233059 RepID=UPI003F953F25
MTSSPPAPSASEPSAPEHLISVVIPVYEGEGCLAATVEDLVAHTAVTTTEGGLRYRVGEVLLVHDGGSDDSPRVIRELAARHDFIRPVWLSRNFGQHAATLAGMASAGGEWIVTMDEDGQHDPAFLGALLDTAVTEGARVVYGRDAHPPRSVGRMSGVVARRAVNALSGGPDASLFGSYRLVLGEVGRGVAAYAGSGVYLDIALGWVVGSAASTPVTMRADRDHRWGYSLRRSVTDFLRMVLTGGTRGLRIVSLLGLILAALGLLAAVGLVVRQLVDEAPVQGWTSLAVVILISSGAIILTLGVIAEYIGVTVNMALGKPLYVATQDPAEGPLGRDAAR